MNINKIKKILLCICLVFIVILVCFTIKKYQHSTPQDPLAEKEEYISHQSYDTLFEIKTPESWKKIENPKTLNKNAYLELYDETKTAYLVVVMNSKKNTSDDFKTYKQKVFNQKVDHYGIKIKEYKDITIDNYPCQYIEFNYTDQDNINTYIRSYAIETKNYYGQIIIWTLAANEDTVQEEFNQIISTYREL